MSRPKQCAPKIWAKFTPHQKRAWRMLYKDFSAEWGACPHKLDAEERQVIASNHATLGVWAIIKD